MPTKKEIATLAARAMVALRVKSQTKARRSEIAKAAAAARWKDHKKKPKKVLASDSMNE